MEEKEVKPKIISEDEEAPGGAVACCCSPVIPLPPMGFPPTLQKVPPTQHTLPLTSTSPRL